MIGRGFRLDSIGGLVVARSIALRSIPGLGHAFSTRRGPGGADFDCAPAAADDRAGARRTVLCSAAEVSSASVVLLRQVHGAHVVRAADLDPAAIPEADAVVATDEGGRRPTLTVRTADCVPVLLAERRGRAVAAAHAGWRGVASGVVLRAIAVLGEAGHEPSSLTAALGPAIGGCCYAVGPEVLERVARTVGVAPGRLALGSPARPRLDLREAVRLQLCAAGLDPSAVHVAPWCTGCSGTLFFSHRRDGARAGRQMACIGWSERGAGPPPAAP